MHMKDFKFLTRAEGTCTGSMEQLSNERIWRELRLKRASVESLAVDGQLAR